MNVAEQSMLCSYASVEILSADKRPTMVALRATLSESEVTGDIWRAIAVKSRYHDITNDIS